MIQALEAERGTSSIPFRYTLCSSGITIAQALRHATFTATTPGGEKGSGEKGGQANLLRK